MIYTTDYINTYTCLNGFCTINRKDFKIIGMPQSEKGRFVVRSIDEDATTYKLTYEDMLRGLESGALVLEVQQLFCKRIAKAKYTFKG